MRRTDLPIDLQNLLKDSRYAVVATTCPDGLPLNSPLSVAFDDDLNMYWGSAVSSQHSRNIDASGQLFAVVFGGVNSPHEGKGIYLRMTAHRLTLEAEVTSALRYYDASFFRKYQSGITFLGACPTGLYKAQHVEVWTNRDKVQDGFFVDTRMSLGA